MDFIERIFGVSPDGGDGTFELLLLLIPFVVAATGAARRADATSRVDAGARPALIGEGLPSLGRR